jgi:esterase/lipase superfamily enzyme
MRREYYAWWSPHLERRMELLVFGHAGARVIVFPTRGGRFYDYENWGLVASLEATIEQGNLQLYCVDSVDRDSLYGFNRPPDERMAYHRQYERYLLEEVTPFSLRRNPNQTMIAHGCSLGAYHAITLAFRHPQRFRKVVALSGRYDLTTPVGSYRALFDDHYDTTIYFHMPCHFLPRLSDPAILGALRRMEIILAVGEGDVFCASNQALSTILSDRAVPHRLDIWPGEAHRAADWRQMVPCYL